MCPAQIKVGNDVDHPPASRGDRLAGDAAARRGEKDIARTPRSANECSLRIMGRRGGEGGLQIQWAEAAAERANLCSVRLAGWSVHLRYPSLQRPRLRMRASLRQTMMRLRMADRHVRGARASPPSLRRKDGRTADEGHRRHRHKPCRAEAHTVSDNAEGSRDGVGWRARASGSAAAP